MPQLTLAAQLAKLDLMERELWTEWDRSKGELVESRPVDARPETSVSTPQQSEETAKGNTKIMALIQGCWDRRSKLLGLLNTEDFKSMNNLPPVKLVAGLDPVEVV
ncbi:MAG: hypothetical protein U0798_15210 [Gemmataceae bacterium]